MYCIGGYIPPDEEIVAMSFFKLCKLGNQKNGYKYLWIRIDDSGGIGTALSFDEMGDNDEADALLTMLKHKGEDDKIRRMNFDEALELYNIIKGTLKIKLSNQLKEEKK